MLRPFCTLCCKIQVDDAYFQGEDSTDFGGIRRKQSLLIHKRMSQPPPQTELNVT